MGDPEGLVPGREKDGSWSKSLSPLSASGYGRVLLADELRSTIKLAVIKVLLVVRDPVPRWRRVQVSRIHKSVLTVNGLEHRWSQETDTSG